MEGGIGGYPELLVVKDWKTGALEKDGQHGDNQKDMVMAYSRSTTATKRTAQQKEKMRIIKTKPKTCG